MLNNNNNNIIRDQKAKVSSGSPRGEVGEIDTRAPFQSVKAAVSLFGEVKLANNKNKPLLRRTRLSSEVGRYALMPHSHSHLNQ